MAIPSTYVTTLVATLVAAVVGCGHGDGAGGDAPARQACRDFRALVRDNGAGALQARALILRGEAMHEVARRSEVVPVRDAARVFAFTLAQQRNRPAIFDTFDAACDDIGA
jgi:hypothetical protein